MRRRRQTSIPLLPGPLIGRRRELAMARQAILARGVRLLTFTGPPGVGKTTLALALAHGLVDRFASRVYLADLSSVTEPDRVARALVEALPGTGSRDPLDRLLTLLADHEILLLLDNFEQIVDAAPLVARLLESCPGLRVIATSRVPLRLRWEHELAVEPLALPEDVDASALALVEAPAVRLFVERARAVDARFAVNDESARIAAAICHRLDGLPLAIELAAARARTLPPESILRQLAGDGRSGQTGGLELLVGGPRDLPPRQRTLRTAIRWSYALLAPREQAVLRRLAIFAGGCTFELAEAVCDADAETVTSLVEQSLLRRVTTGRGEPRFQMLETIRQYSLELLATEDDLATLERRHAASFVDLAEQAEPELTGPNHGVWLDRLDAERDNLRAAERWALARGDADTVLRLGAALWQFWWSRADAAEARERVDAIEAMARLAPLSAVRARAEHGAGVLAVQMGDRAVARRLLEAAVHDARSLGDSQALALALGSLGRLEFVQGRYAEARAVLDECLTLSRDSGDQTALIRALSRRGFVEYLDGHQERARVLLAEGLELARRIGARAQAGELLIGIGDSYQADGALPEAIDAYREAVAMLRELGEGNGLAWGLGNLGSALVLQGEPDAGRAALSESLALARRMGNRLRQSMTLWAAALLAAAEGAGELAIRLEAAARTAADETGVVLASVIRERRAATFAEARLALDERVALAAEAGGRTTTLSQAVEEALAWLGDHSPAPQADAGIEDGVLAPPEVSDLATPVRVHQLPPSVSVLTRREREVAVLVGRGLSNRQIAQALVVTEGTAANYVQRVLHRLNFRRRAEIAAWTAGQGLLTASARVG